MKPLPSNVVAVLTSNGTFSMPWLYFFQSLVALPPPSQPIIVGTSPFTFTAGDSGSVVIEGGTVNSINIIRGITTIVTGLTGGVIPIRKQDKVVIDYSVAPDLTFLPD
jgi:hypothetical protein